MYQRRVELCLGECRGGERVLEVGYGSGITFPNLHDLYDDIYGIDLDADPQQVTDTFAEQGIPVKLEQGNLLALDYPDGYFDTILLISILEHLKPQELTQAFNEIKRTLRPGGQVVYGVPVERPLMVFMFRLLGVNIRDHHFSTHADVSRAAGEVFSQTNLIRMSGAFGLSGPVYEVGHFTKAGK
jgi:2-polyprenyl-3-methyl-5-hydroxy-6-metoxy-1,4-benzoquinol methylase